MSECREIEGRDENVEGVLSGAKESMTGPVNSIVVKGGEFNLICTPIDHRVDLGQPRFAQNEIVFVEGVENGVDVVEALVATECDSSSVICKGRRTIMKKDWNSRGVMNDDLLNAMTEGRTNDVRFRTTIDEYFDWLSIDVGSEGEELVVVFVDGLVGQVQEWSSDQWEKDR